jgi:hypothetical protein
LTVSSGDTVTWSWSPPSLVTGVSYQVVQVEDAASTTLVTNGFSSGNATSTGKKIGKKNFIKILKKYSLYTQVHIRISLTRQARTTTGRAM